VDAHLKRLKLFDYFSPVVCADDVPAGRTKPHPDLFLKALGILGIRADEALAFEDSPNGALAARAAGIFVVTVPNPMTALLHFEGGDLRLESLAAQPLGSLLARL
jgi:putative hydrolase of the HAD superfamily